MNPDEFARLKFKPPLEQEVLAALLEGPPSWKPSDEAIYDLLVRIFAKHVERFRRQRALAVLPTDHDQFARLPGGHALVLWPPGSTLLRGKHVPDRIDESAPGFESVWDIGLNVRPNYDSGAYQAARIIVGGCGPRFHRALQVIERATDMLYRYRMNNVLSGNAEPHADGKNGPYR